MKDDKTRFNVGDRVVPIAEIEPPDHVRRVVDKREYGYLMEVAGVRRYYSVAKAHERFRLFTEADGEAEKIPPCRFKPGDTWLVAGAAHRGSGLYVLKGFLGKDSVLVDVYHSDRIGVLGLTEPRSFLDNLRAAYNVMTEAEWKESHHTSSDKLLGKLRSLNGDNG